MDLIVYGIPNCDTVKKARTWLNDHGLQATFHDFKKTRGPSRCAGHLALAYRLGDAAQPQGQHLAPTRCSHTGERDRQRQRQGLDADACQLHQKTRDRLALGAGHCGFYARPMACLNP